MTSRALLLALFLLQVFHVLFLALHDWVPLGRLNDTRAVRAENSFGKLLLATLIGTVPFLPPLIGSAHNLHTGFPNWVTRWLVIGYGLLFVGELQAWWIPYTRGANPERIERYRVMFGRTHAFLPERHGITPNTLHVILHLCTLFLLLLLGLGLSSGTLHW